MENEYIYGSGDPTSLYDFVREQLQDVDTTDLNDEVSDQVQIEITPEKVYFWTRVYLKDEDPGVKIGDTIWIEYTPSGERLETKFITYGKKGLERDHDGEVTNYNPEDDKKILCLIIEEKTINESDDIPFIRTLFKLGRHYEFQVLRRTELIFIKEDGEILDYYDSEF
jgi:hypothetical protein